jgi:hypothetical protein
LVEALDDETIVFDTARHKAHCLNRVASLVWSRCDGRTTVLTVVRALRDETGVPADEDLVRLALAQLGRRGLLEAYSPTEPPDVPRTARGLSRRMALYGLSTALILTITAPEAAAAASCVAFGNVCFQKGNFTPCCPGLACTDIQGSKIRCE